VNPLERALLGLALVVLALFGSTNAADAQPALSADEMEFLREVTNPPYRNVPPIVPTAGHSWWDLAQLGRLVATHVRHGVDTLDVQPWLKRMNPTLTGKQATWFVVRATRIWAPDFLEWYIGCGDGPMCQQVMPKGAVTTAWGNPADLFPAYQYPPG
jgi:hypothetical protein